MPLGRLPPDFEELVLAAALRRYTGPGAEPVPCALRPLIKNVKKALKLLDETRTMRAELARAKERSAVDLAAIRRALARLERKADALDRRLRRFEC